MVSRDTIGTGDNCRETVQVIGESRQAMIDTLGNDHLLRHVDIFTEV